MARLPLAPALTFALLTLLFCDGRDAVAAENYLPPIGGTGGTQWTPRFSGKWTFHCRVNSDFAYAEANPDNNEVTAVLEVVEPAPPAQ